MDLRIPVSIAISILIIASMLPFSVQVITDLMAGDIVEVKEESMFDKTAMKVNYEIEPKEYSLTIDDVIVMMLTLNPKSTVYHSIKVSIKTNGGGTKHTTVNLDSADFWQNKRDDVVAQLSEYKKLLPADSEGKASITYEYNQYGPTDVKIIVE